MRNEKGQFIKGQEPHNKRKDIRKNINIIIKMYKENLIPITNIANRFKCERHLIYTLLRKNNSLIPYSERRILSYRKGTLKVWNKGLTKEDGRVKKLIKKLEENIYSKRRNKTYEEFYGEERAKEIKEKIGKIQSIIKRGKGNPMYGRCGILNPKYGKEVSLETRRKLRFNTLGKKIHSEKHKLELRNRMISEENPMKNPINKQKLSLMITGKKNPNWHGGISFEPYTLEFNNLLRKEIRKRDNQVCMNCGIHREKLNKAFDIHHVNYDKKLSIPENLICLCRICHLLTNLNREYWTKLFQYKLSKLYNYQYKESLPIINLEIKNAN